MSAPRIPAASAMPRPTHPVVLASMTKVMCSFSRLYDQKSLYPVNGSTGVVVVKVGFGSYLANKSVGELVQAPFTGTMYSNKESSTEIILMTVPSCLVHLKAVRKFV